MRLAGKSRSGSRTCPLLRQGNSMGVIMYGEHQPGTQSDVKASLKGKE